MRSLYPYCGSKQKSAGLIASIIRQEGAGLYAEPMAGSAAVFFELKPTGLAYLNDAEPLIANLLAQIRDNIEGVVESLRGGKWVCKETFEVMQQTVRKENPVTAAAIWYYLLTVCYNGVVKYRPDGTPLLTWGDRWKTWYEKLEGRILNLRVASLLLKEVEIHSIDYSLVPPADIAFFDPPWFDSAENYGVVFNHNRLRDYLANYRGRWLLTINGENGKNHYSDICKWWMELNPFYSVAPVSQGRGKRREYLLANFKPKMFGGG